MISFFSNNPILFGFVIGFLGFAVLEFTFHLGVKAGKEESRIEHSKYYAYELQNALKKELKEYFEGGSK